jgi:hypothetical protein
MGEIVYYIETDHLYDIDENFYGASSLKQQSAGRYVRPLVHIIMIPSQPVFAVSP